MLNNKYHAIQKVCIITSVHNPLDVRIFYRQALTLKNNGYKVTLIAPSPESKIVEEIEIIGFSPAPNRISRFYSHSHIFNLARELKADIYHIHDPDLLFVGLKILRKLRVPVIYDSHEDYPLSVISDKYYIPKHFRYLVSLITDKLEMYMAKKMTGVIAVYPHRINQITKKDQHKLILPNFPPSARFIKSELDKKDMKRIVYLGSLSESRGESVLLELMKILQQKDKNYLLEIIGFFDNDELESVFLNNMNTMGLRNVRYHGRVLFENVPKLLENCAFGIIPWLPTQQHLYAANPTKMFEYMAASIVVIAPDYGIFTDTLKSSNIGILFDLSDIHSLADSIQELSRNKATMLKKMGNARELFEKRYNWEVLSDQFLAFYSKVLETNSV